MIHKIYTITIATAIAVFTTACSCRSAEKGINNLNHTDIFIKQKPVRKPTSTNSTGITTVINCVNR